MKMAALVFIFSLLSGCATYDDGIRVSADDYESDREWLEAASEQQRRIDSRNVRGLVKVLDVLDALDGDEDSSHRFHHHYCKNHL